MSISLEKQKKAIHQKENELELRKKLLKEKERKLHTQKMISLGSLISKAGLDCLDTNTLFGALLEIKESSVDSEILKDWSLKGEHTLNHSPKHSLSPLIVSFESIPEAEALAVLKKNKFKLNKFRQEWYGYGKKESLEEQLKDYNPQIETTSF
jgi:hypothetical protein